MDEPIAYLKADLPEEDPSPVIQLDDADAPVLKSFVGDLLVFYVIDLGDHFSFVRGRDLQREGPTVKLQRPNVVTRHSGALGRDRTRMARG